MRRLVVGALGLAVVAAGGLLDRGAPRAGRDVDLGAIRGERNDHADHGHGDHEPYVPGSAGAAGEPSLLGPLGPPLAQVWFVRARLARDAGAEGRSLALLHAALDLDPVSLAGRVALADHMGLTLASAEGGRSAPERLAWLEEALALLDAGPGSQTAELAFHAGILLVSHAQTDPELPWSGHGGGAAGLWLAAAERFHHAEGLGHPAAGVAEAFALEQAEGLTRE